MNFYRVIARNVCGVESTPSTATSVDILSAPIAVDDDASGLNADDTVTPYTTAVNQSLSVSAADGVLANDFDLQNLPLSISAHTDPAHGTLTLNDDGGFTYDPNPEFSGTDTFTYTISNGTLESQPATVSIDVANQPVVTTPDSYSVDAGTPLTIGGTGANSLGSNDSNPNSSAVTYSAASQPQHGTLALAADGTFTYTPTSGFSGYDHFSYSVNDGFQNSNVSNVVLSVATTPYAPPTIGDTSFNPQTFDNSLKGLWNSYIAAKDRLGQVASAMATFDQSALALQNIDPTNDSAGAAIDATVAKMDNVYLAADRYQKQLSATNSAMGAYLASVWLNTQSVFDVTSAINALPLRPLGIVPDSDQLATMEAGLNNFAAAANVLVSYTDFSVKAAETVHAIAEGTLQVVGTATAVGDIFTAGELASEEGCAAVIKAVVTKAAATAGAVVVSAAVASDAANMARQFGVSEDTLKIGADLLQVVLLAHAARTEAKATEAQANIEASKPSAIELAKRVGAEGEQLADIIKNTEHIESLTHTANYRIPDVLDRPNKIIAEVKNVAELSYTSQLQDFSAYAKQEGYTFKLIVRRNTTLTGPLQQAVDMGEIVLQRLLP